MEYGNQIESQRVEFRPTIDDLNTDKFTSQVEESSNRYEVFDDDEKISELVLPDSLPVFYENEEPKTLPIGKKEFYTEDTIYIFDPSKKLGIKFTSFSPENSLDTGVFSTSEHSISTVDWDESINSHNTTASSVVDGVKRTVMTYITSREGFLNILHEIMKQKGNGIITIDIGMSEFKTRNYSTFMSDNEKVEVEEQEPNLGLNYDSYFDTSLNGNNDKLELEKIKSELSKYKLGDDPYIDNRTNLNRDENPGFWDEYNDTNRIRL